MQVLLCQTHPAPCNSNCRGNFSWSAFDAGSLAILRGITTLRLLGLEHYTGKSVDGYREWPTEEMLAAIGDLQQHNPTLKVAHQSTVQLCIWSTNLPADMSATPLCLACHIAYSCMTTVWLLVKAAWRVTAPEFY